MNTLKTNSILTEFVPSRNAFLWERQWSDNFKGTLFFSRGRTNSYGVAIGYSGAKYFILEERKMDKNGCLLLLDVTIDEQNFILINLYTVKTEENQVNIINELNEMLKSVYNISAKQIILGVDFNLILSLY